MFGCVPVRPDHAFRLHAPTHVTEKEKGSNCNNISVTCSLVLERFQLHCAGGGPVFRHS